MPLLSLITSLFLLSQSAIFIRIAEAPAAAIGFWRLVIACPILLLLLLWKKKNLSISRKDAASILLCAFFLFSHWYTWVLAVQKTSTANAIILFCSNPIYIAVGAWIFYRERIGRRHGLSLVICFLGIFVMVKGSLKLSPEHLRGDAIGFLSSILFAAYVLSSKGIRRRLDNIPFSLSIYSLCCAAFLAVALLKGEALFGYSGKTWAAFSALAFGSTLLGHSLFTYCLNHFNVNLMSVSTLSEPVFTALVALWVFGEPVRVGTAFGFLLVTAGILVLYWPYLKGVLRRTA